MSNYEDDQSEDGELARSPTAQEEMDFSLSEEDIDTNDSLDIRPPQAKIIYSRPKDDRKNRHGGKTERHKEHSHRDKKHAFRERDKIEMKSKKENEMRHGERKSGHHGKYVQPYHDKQPHRPPRDRELFRDSEPYRERERDKDTYPTTKEAYRDKDRERERDEELYASKEPYREKEAYREKERERVNDIYISKEPYREKDKDREKDTLKNTYREKDSYISKEPFREKERERLDGREKEGREKGRSRHTSSDEAGGRACRGDKELEDLRTRLLSKRRSKEQGPPQERRHPNRDAHLQRRDKLLNTEREMSRRKEEVRAVLEERRSRLSKPSSPPPAKRARPSPEVVTVSDTSDHDQQEEGEHSGTSSNSSSGSGTDSEADTASGEEEESAEESGEEEAEAEAEAAEEGEGSVAVLPASPTSIHSDTPKRRSRSHSFSPPRASNGTDARASPHASPPASPKPPPPGSPQPPLPPYFPALQGCRSVEEFQCLNRIEEGTYGVVYRARDKTTEEIVALKRLKMEKEKEGFPITSLREINTLLKGQHPNIVTVREIVVGSNMDKIFIVMDYVEHDLKGLMETMRARKQVFLPGEVKCLMQQLLRAVDHLHDNWILHRDLKTSNLLLSHKGVLKVGDFGLAREYGSPLKNYTPVVVTLWYRAPELLLGARTYSTPIDMWSVGCIFSEFITMQALFPGKSEVDQLNRIFKELGTPNETVWPGWSQLSGARAQWAEQAGAGLRGRVGPGLSEAGLALLQGLLTYEPARRLQSLAALQHAFFKEVPLAIDPAMFPTWPAKSEGGRKQHSPKAPSGGELYKQTVVADEIIGFHMGANAPAPFLPPPTSFSLKF